jgi:hypothetical protein
MRREVTMSIKRLMDLGMTLSLSIRRQALDGLRKAPFLLQRTQSYALFQSRIAYLR